jgi:hypothetical protein
VRAEQPWWNPAASAPVWLQVLFWVAFAVVAVTFAQTVLVLAAALRWRGRGDGVEAGFLWVFVVPALDEEVTIADAVARLAAVEATHRIILVVDDGSTDATPRILAGLDVPGLRVLTRHPPEARQGKAAALNAAYAHVRDTLLREPAYAGFGAGRTIIAVVDADGRLDPHSPRLVAAHVADERVGGVQLLVRIYNRRGLLTRAQDLEFGVFGLVMQAGRARWGSANMGGNGQFNRLAALADVAEPQGPWRDRLTEDQDLGVRLLQHGWRSVQENGAAVHQQGLSSLRRLYRQRTRWAQGAWQAIGLVRTHGGMRHGVRARADALVYLLTPLLQVVVGAYLVVDVADVLVTRTDPLPGRLTVLVIVLAPTLSGLLVAVVVAAARALGVRGLPGAVAAGLLYPLYNWLLLPTVPLALVRHLRGVTNWAKTAREPLGAGSDELSAG